MKIDTEVIVLILSGGFIVVGTLLWQKGSFLLKNGKKAKAIVLENNESDGTYYPVVKFLTDKQEWIIQQLSIGHAPAKRDGTKIDVIYDPENPKNVEINLPFLLSILPRLFVAFGIAALIFGVLEFLNVTDFFSNVVME